MKHPELDVTLREPIDDAVPPAPELVGSPFERHVGSATTPHGPVLAKIWSGWRH